MRKKSKMEDLEKGHFAHGKKGKQKPQIASYNYRVFETKTGSENGTKNGVTTIRR